MKQMVDIDIDKIVKTTEKAILVKIDDEEIWLPKSQIKIKGNPSKSDAVTEIEVAEWLAMDKGLI